MVEILTKSTLTVFGTVKAGADRGSIAGFQVINVPYGPGGPPTAMIAGPYVGGMEISWFGEDQKLYGIETNSNLILPGGWSLWKTGLTGDGNTLSVTNTIGPDQTFYRVISE